MTETPEKTLGDIGFRVAGVILLAASFLVAWLLMDFKTFRQNPLMIPESGMTLMVKPGMTLKSIAGLLDDKGVLDKPVYLVALGRYLDLDSRIKAGEFRLPPVLHQSSFYVSSMRERLFSIT